MEILYIKNNIKLINPADFELKHIFDCGQCFRFNETKPNVYTGVAFGKALKIEQKNNEVILYNTSMKDFEDIWLNFFDLNCDYAQIKSNLDKDKYMHDAIEYGYGIRILRQDLWETIVSFIISASNNIPRIKGIIERLCENFGEKIEYMGNIYYSFPTIERISNLSLDDLSVIRAGFRDKYILSAAKYFSQKNPQYLNSLTTSDAKKELMSITGIGNKVSDCILLFGMHRTDSFPVDVWIKRIMEYCYFDKEVSINEISELANSKFSTLGGFAQQYLFYWAHGNKIGVSK